MNYSNFFRHNNKHMINYINQEKYYVIFTEKERDEIGLNKNVINSNIINKEEKKEYHKKIEEMETNGRDYKISNKYKKQGKINKIFENNPMREISSDTSSIGYHDNDDNNEEDINYCVRNRFEPLKTIYLSSDLSKFSWADAMDLEDYIQYLVDTIKILDINVQKEIVFQLASKLNLLK